LKEDERIAAEELAAAVAEEEAENARLREQEEARKAQEKALEEDRKAKEIAKQKAAEAEKIKAQEAKNKVPLTEHELEELEKKKNRRNS